VGAIDLRSDTVTQPTPAMREAMARAEVGDDGWGEDPTVNRLQEMAAERLGKEAGLFMPSGTMSNLVAILTHCQRGDEIILGNEAHTFYYEVGGAAALGGVHVRVVYNDPQGRMDPEEVEGAIRLPGLGFPRTALICLENTHNRCGGAVLSPEYTATMVSLAKRHEIPVHLDGARIFNGAVYLGCDVRQLTDGVDTVSFCLSKGLSAPVGSLLCGSADFIGRARRYRRMVGGVMRQSGVLAAAGILALETMVERLAEDHENARHLAHGLADVPGLSVDAEAVQTNIVIADTANPAAEVAAELAQEGVKASVYGPNRLRFVTHYGIGREDIDTALALIASVMTRLQRL